MAMEGRRRREDDGKPARPHPRDSCLLSNLYIVQAGLAADFRVAQLKAHSGPYTEKVAFYIPG